MYPESLREESLFTFLRSVNVLPKETSAREKQNGPSIGRAARRKLLARLLTRRFFEPCRYECSPCTRTQIVLCQPTRRGCVAGWEASGACSSCARDSRYYPPWDPCRTPRIDDSSVNLR